MESFRFIACRGRRQRDHAEREQSAPRASREGAAPRRVPAPWYGVCAVCALLLPRCEAANVASYSVSNTPAYYSGDFHSGRRLSIFDDATTITLRKQRWTVGLTLPYVEIHDLPNGATYNRGAVLNGAPASGASDVSGLGDLQLLLRTKVASSRGLRPTVSPYLQVDIPTASTSKGLGTGLASYTAGVELRENLGWVFPYAQAGYAFVQSNAVYRLRDAWVWNIGVAAAVFQSRRYGSNFLSLGYSGNTSEVPGESGVQVVELAWEHQFPWIGSRAFSLQPFLLKGLTSSSPDFGGGVELTVLFR